MFAALGMSLFKIYAAACTPGTGGEFFGFPTWYQYLDGETGASGRCTPTVSQPEDFALIGLAIIDMLVTIAGIMAVVFVIYGGVKMIMAQGDPEKIKSGRNTVINALVGVVIAIIATAVVTFIGTKF